MSKDTPTSHEINDAHSTSGQYRPREDHSDFQPFNLNPTERSVTTIPKTMTMREQRDAVMKQAQKERDVPDLERSHDRSYSR